MKNALPEDSLAPELWVDALTTRVLGHGENRLLETVDSTNTELRRMAEAGAPAGSLCMAEAQTAGKGRLGRVWSSPAGCGLWLSVLLRPALRPEDAPLMTLCAAMAMARAVRESCGAEVRIKWPNDLVCGGRKICGILLECSADVDKVHYVIVGTGLNVRSSAYPPEIAKRAAALEEFSNPLPLRRDVLIRYLYALEELSGRVEREGFAGIAADYAAQSCTLGNRVQVSGGMELTGVAEDIDATGALLVRTEDGTLHRVLAGDVSVRGVMGYV